MAVEPTILVVEDDLWQAEHFKSQLEAAGFLVRLAHDPLQAIDQIDQQLPDLIVLDMLLPGANGMAFLHELRSYSDTAKLPVVMCSSIAENLPADHLKDYGVVEVIDKVNIGPDQLVATVREALL